jgi:hypothetical protein
MPAGRFAFGINNIRSIMQNCMLLHKKKMQYCMTGGIRPKMESWHFLDYWPRAGENPIRNWENSQDEKVRNSFDAVRDALAQTPDWDDHSVHALYRDLERDESGMGEIVFEAHYERKGKRPERFRRFRAFVRVRDEQHDCILFLCCEKWPRRGVYDPPNAPKLAMRQLIAFEAGQGFIYGHV